jgi:hypothetical protein
MSSTPLHRFPQSVWASAQDLAQHVRLGLVNLAMKILPIVNRRRAITVRAKLPRCTRSGALARTPRRALATLAPGRARCRAKSSGPFSAASWAARLEISPGPVLEI